MTPFNMTRSPRNPIITPGSIKPSRPDFKVEGTFNAGVIDRDGETLMLLRVAESVKSDQLGEVRVPVMEMQDGRCVLTIKSFLKTDPSYDFSDPRTVVFQADRSKLFLTSLSHIRLARSRNGVDFEVDDQPFIYPSHRYELFGCEDPRVVQIDGACYINYSSVSDLGICTSLVRTQDFVTTENLGVIFAPDNRDVCLFPEKIGNHYWALHRPAPAHFGSPGIWIATSPDLIHWGDHHSLLESSASGWDQRKVGGGAPMLKTAKGWLQIYHGVDATQRYCLGALLLDLADPRHILARLSEPLMEPITDYEKTGFFGNVVFTCGATIRDDVLHVYYGAADEVMAVATLPLSQLWTRLGVVEPLGGSWPSGPKTRAISSPPRLAASMSQSRFRTTRPCFQWPGDPQTMIDTPPIRAAELLRRFKQEAPAAQLPTAKLHFKGVEGFDVYNTTAPFRSVSRTVIAGRVERRDSEKSKVRFFENRDDAWVLIPDAPAFDLQDPFFTFIQQELVLGGVETYEVDGRLHWQTVFLRGRDIFDLKRFFVGPAGMKDIRLTELADGRLGIFTRPQGEKGGRGTIGYTEAEGLEGLSIDLISQAPLLQGMFHPLDWGGANETTRLPNGEIGVLSHIAHFEGDDPTADRHYYATTFVFDPQRREVKDFKVIACRDQLAAGPAKRPDLVDVVFSSGLTFDGEQVRLYAGASDAEAHWLELRHPFAEHA